MTLATTHALANFPSLHTSRLKEPPQAPGIYFVMQRPGILLYVGKARNLLERWRAHHRRAQLVKDDTWIVWKLVPPQISDTDLSALERWCIRHYRPELNDTPMERPQVVDARPFVERQRQHSERLGALLDDCQGIEAQIVAAEDTMEQQLTTAANWLRRYRQGLNGVLAERQQQQTQIVEALQRMKEERKRFLPLVRKVLENAN